VVFQDSEKEQEGCDADVKRVGVVEEALEERGDWR
jgi:hypothetical protein